MHLRVSLYHQVLKIINHYQHLIYIYTHIEIHPEEGRKMMVYGMDERRRGVLISSASSPLQPNKHLNKTSTTSLMLHHFSLKAIIIIFTLVFTALLLFLPLLLPPLPPPPSLLLLVPILMLALLLFLALSPSQSPLVPAVSSSVVWPYIYMICVHICLYVEY